MNSNNSSINSERDSQPDFEPFELDDKYFITSLIREGGLGKVFAGETKLVHRPIAVKILHQQLVAQEDMLLRFQLEAEIAGSLNHTNIVNVSGSGITPDGRPYIVMDLLKGKNLQDILATGVKLELASCLDIFIQLARALDYTHVNKVIHRDLKPTNVMLVDDADTDSGLLVKLLDFGIAKSSPVEDTIARENTLPDTIFGSVLYMSPEHVLGEPIDYRSDIYSFGCLLFHMLTGKPPYEGLTPKDCMQKHAHESIPNLQDYIPEEACVGQLSTIINQCMRKDPVQRFETAELLLNALENVREQCLAASKTAKEFAETTEKEQISAQDADKAKLQNKNNIFALLTISGISAALSAVPFFYDLDLSKFESKIESKKASQQSAEQAANNELVQKASIKVNALLEKVGEAVSEKNYVDAESLARTAYISSLVLQPNDPRISESLYLLGQVLELKGNYEGALQAYTWTLSSRESIYGPLAPQTTSVRQRIAVLKKFVAIPE